MKIAYTPYALTTLAERKINKKRIEETKRKKREEKRIKRLDEKPASVSSAVAPGTLPALGL